MKQAAANTANPQVDLVLSCPTATATVQFGACPGGKLAFAIAAAGVYVESSTVATTKVPAYAAATHVFEPYQNAVAVVICTIAETPGLSVTYSTDPCTRSHAVVAGPAAVAVASSSSSGSSHAGSSASSSGASDSGASSGSSGGASGSSASSGSSSSGGAAGGSASGSSASGSSGAGATPRTGLALSCTSASAPVPFAACPGGKLVYAIPTVGVYVESSTVPTTTIPSYSAATHVFQPYQNAVAIVICTIAETPGLSVTYSSDPCTRSHALIAGPAAGGSSSSSGSSTSGSTDVLTYHNDSMRTGQNLTETVLTPGNVSSSGFGLLRMLAADGSVDATPLVVSKLTIANALHNVVYVATENDSVYAYDADSGQLLKKVSLLGANETASDDLNCWTYSPEIGITATPVIDRSAGPNGTMFLVAMSKDGSGNHYQRLHALDLATLADRITPVVIQASFPGTAYGANGEVSFDASLYTERGALLLSQGQIFTAWASHCDSGNYTGWIIAYSESTLTRTQVINLTPNGTQGAIWDVGGIAADGSGGLYTLLGNGLFDTTLNSGNFPARGDYGNSAVRMDMSGGSLAVTDYFSSWDTTAQSVANVDLGSGSPLLIPDQVDATGTTRHLMLAAGKDHNLYLLDRDDMGRYNGNAGTSVDTIYQELPAALPQALFSAPVYFNGSIYFADSGGTLKQYALAAARLPTTPNSQSSTVFAYPGASPSVSASGSGNAIVWAAESHAGSPAVLHAYNPANLAIEFYDSTQAPGGRDAFGTGNKFITPVTANGKVFIGTPSGVAVFGLL
jgi:hypothetical protein